MYCFWRKHHDDEEMTLEIRSQDKGMLPNAQTKHGFTTDKQTVARETKTEGLERSYSGGYGARKL